GPQPEGVTAILEPTTLARAVAEEAIAAPDLTTPGLAGSLRSAQLGPVGKWAATAQVAALEPDRTVRATLTDSAGAFEFSDVAAPGLYLLTLSRAGFQTQRFVIDAEQLAGGTPLDVA